MRLTLRRLWPSTRLFAAILLLSALLPLPHNNKIAGVGSICAFHRLTGVPCPACGLTRSWVSMAHGHWSEALVWHPLGPPLFLAALGYVFWSAWVASARPPFAAPRKLQNATIVVGAALLLGFWAARLAGVFPLSGS